jgi:hypothetical protein
MINDTASKDLQEKLQFESRIQLGQMLREQSLIGHSPVIRSLIGGIPPNPNANYPPPRSSRVAVHFTSFILILELWLI